MNDSEIIYEFLNFYLTPAFGSRSKSEIDLKVFELLLKSGLIEYDCYKISIKLKITPVKARNLMLNARLRSLSNEIAEDEYDKRFIELLKSLKFKVSQHNSDIILFYVPDPLFREYIKFFFKQRDIIWDSSFNSEIVKVRLDDFLDVVYEKLNAEHSLKVNWVTLKPKIKANLLNFLKDTCTGLIDVIIKQFYPYL